MAYRETVCSALIQGKVFQGCHSNKKPTDDVLTFYPNLAPTPLPINGPPNGGGDCDCSSPATYSGSGQNWQSFIYTTGGETWQGNAANLSTIQTFHSGSFENLGVCNKYGFKNVAASRFWHGTYAWTSLDACPLPPTSSAADEIRYLTVIPNISLNWIENGAGAEEDTLQHIASSTGYMTVNQATGIISSTLSTAQTDTRLLPSPVTLYSTNGGAGYSQNYDGSDYTTFDIGGVTYIDGICGSDLHCANQQQIPSYMASTLDIYLGGPITTIDSVIPAWNSAFTSNTMSAVTNTNSYSDSVAFSDGASDWRVSIYWSRTATTYAWNFEFGWGPAVGGYFTQSMYYSGTSSLSSTSSAALIEQDCEFILSYWNLNDDYEYPWRTDGYEMYMPMVIRKEVQGDITPLNYGFIPVNINNYRNPLTDVSGSNYTSPDWIPTYGTQSWQDPNSFGWILSGSFTGPYATGTASANMDGSVIGAPNLQYYTSSSGPASGSVQRGLGWGSFDFYYLDNRFCATDPDFGCATPYLGYVYAYGGLLADSEISQAGLTDGGAMTFLPQTATHWLNNDFANYIPRGAYVSCYEVVGLSFVVVKWAETRIPIQSYNFFRPCGSDRVLIDETTANVFDVAPLTYSVSWGALTGGETILIYQTGGSDGIYTGCTQIGAGPYVLVPGTLVAPLPSDFNRTYDYSPNGMAGIVRFPNAWSMCGQQQISTVTPTGSNSIVTFNLSQTNLRTGDEIDLYNIKETLLFSSESVNRIDDSNFIVNITASSLTSAYYAQSSGSPSYFWNDTTQKLQYRYGQWNSNNRLGETSSFLGCNSSCVNYTPCFPSVVCFSPNGESFGNGNTYWFNGVNTASAFYDAIYGTSLNLNVEFWMPSPLWQQPVNPYNADGSVSAVRDDGGCQTPTDDGMGNITIYFWQDVCEGLCSVPSGAPALPSGSIIQPMTEPAIFGNPPYSFSPPAFEPWQIYNNWVANCGHGCYLSPQDTIACN